MKLRAILLLCAVIVVGFIIIYVIPIWNTPKPNSLQNEQGGQQSGRRSEWTRKTVDGVELWLVWKEVTHPADGEWMHIYAFMEGQYFDEETLRQLFARMSEEYSKYKYLSVDIYNDEEKLAKRIDYDRNSRLFSSYSHLQLEKPKEEQTPRNYFDAQYYRAARTDSLQSEWFSYTPDPTKDDTITITLKP